MTENVYFHSQKELITLTNGMDLPLMRLLMDDDAKEIWHMPIVPIHLAKAHLRN